MELPKCDYQKECSTVAFMIKARPEGCIPEDIFVCAKCCVTRFTEEESSRVPESGEVLECLEFVEHHLNKINHFREWHKLDQKCNIQWTKFLPDLKIYELSHMQLKKDLALAKTTNDWAHLPYLLIEAKELVNSVKTSKIFNEYCKELSFREFRDDKFDANKMHYASKIWTNKQLMKLRNHLTTTEYGRVIIKIGEMQEICKKHERIIKEQEREIIKKDQEIDQKDARIEFSDQEILKLRGEIQNEEQKAKQLMKELSEKDEFILAHRNEVYSLTHRNIELQEEIEKIYKDIEALKKTLEQKERVVKGLQNYKRKEAIKELGCQSDRAMFAEKSKHMNGSGGIRGIMKRKIEAIRETLELDFCFSYKYHRKFLKEVKHHKITSLESLSFDRPDLLEEPETLNQFLSDLICENTNYCKTSFIKNSNSLMKKNIHCLCLIITPIIKTLPCVTQEVCFSGTKVSKTQLEGLFVASKNAKKISFINCKIEPGNECGFGEKLEGATFETLDFYGTGKGYYSNWS
ncbi:unnamed protein product [Moneuplotes crassus]|uniref:Uncharacterized protein n=1 Tax=Euplotes crassus TaxID=5936 RepID=A0AAD1YAI8_EUPCR|nr:unnamed protein product [Moneuplotes crassus]